MPKKFDFNEAVKALQSGQKLTGDDGILTPLIKQLTEAALEGEIDSHLAAVDTVGPHIYPTVLIQAILAPAPVFLSPDLLQTRYRVG